MMDGKDLFPIGRVIKPHGVRGKLKIDYFGEDFGQFHYYQKVFIEDWMGRLKSYEILEATPHPPRLILQLKEIGTIEDVEPLVGQEIFIRKECLPNLPEGEYYWIEILGMAVETEEGKRIGKVREIFPTGAHDVYVIQGERREILLPATDGVIQSIDRKRGVMKVVWTKGLWEKEDEI